MENKKTEHKLIKLYTDIYYHVEYTYEEQEEGNVTWVNWVAREVEELSEPKPNWDKKGWEFDFKLDEEVISGWTKWDGCSEFSIEHTHICGLYGMKNIYTLFERIYKQVAELCGQEFKEL